MNFMKNEKQLTLSDLHRGNSVQVIKMTCGCRERERLASMGLYPGCKVWVLGKNGNGAIFLRSGETSMVVDGELCSSVMCR